MNLPVPKYQIGQRVFLGYVEDAVEELPCPDCNGTKTWFAVAPNGLILEARCPRCDGYSQELPTLAIRDWKPAVRQLTIGSIRIDTARVGGDTSGWNSEPVEYMCLETGVGSGSIYRESRLHTNEQLALAQAEADCAAARAERDSRDGAAIAAKRRISSLTFRDAALENTRAKVFSAWHTYRRLREDLDEWLTKSAGENDLTLAVDQITKIVEWEDGYRDPAPLEKLIRLINAEGATMEDVRAEAAKVF